MRVRVGHAIIVGKVESLGTRLTCNYMYIVFLESDVNSSIYTPWTGTYTMYSVPNFNYICTVTCKMHVSNTTYIYT